MPLVDHRYAFGITYYVLRKTLTSFQPAITTHVIESNKIKVKTCVTSPEPPYLTSWHDIVLDFSILLGIWDGVTRHCSRLLRIEIGGDLTHLSLQLFDRYRMRSYSLG